MAANNYIVENLKKTAALCGSMLYCPQPAYCTDNGIMIAWAAYEYVRTGYTPPDMHTWQVKAHWPLSI